MPRGRTVLPCIKDSVIGYSLVGRFMQCQQVKITTICKFYKHSLCQAKSGRRSSHVPVTVGTTLALPHGAYTHIEKTE